MGNTPPELIAVHMFSAHLADIYNADSGQCVNCKLTLKFLFGIADPIDTVLNALLPPKGPLGPNRKIEIMRIAAHGDAGHLIFPAMQNPNVVSYRWGWLQSFYTPHTKLEIHGCGVASQTSTLRSGANLSDPDISDTVPGTFWGRADGLGLIYLRKVARTFGIPVTAGIDYQVVEPNNWEFEHDTVTVFPSGKFRYDDCWTRGMTAEAINKQAEAESSRINTQLIMKHKPAEARVHLEMLIRNYPNTAAAERARKRIAENNFAPLPPMVPDPDKWP
jgi:hypothetical protein